MAESAGHTESRLSRATAQRLSQYLRCLDSAARSGGTISSDELSSTVGVSAAQVRRDLGSLGHLGQRGIGYDAAALATVIKRTLGIDRRWRAALIGVGNLARALLRYRGFHEQGFEIVALFDTDPRKLGSDVEGRTVLPLTQLADVVRRDEIELALLTVPSEAAQCVADLLVAAGVKGMMNFAPVMVKVPTTVRLVTVDLAIQLEQLAFAVQVGEG